MKSWRIASLNCNYDAILQSHSNSLEILEVPEETEAMSGMRVRVRGEILSLDTMVRWAAVLEKMVVSEVSHLHNYAGILLCLESRWFMGCREGTHIGGIH